MRELESISDAWLETKNAREKAFSLGRFQSDYVRRFPQALIRQGDRIVAFANVLTNDKRTSASIDLMRHLPDAPGSTMMFLFAELMLALKKQGYGEFNLGMAPLAGLASHPTARTWDRLGAFLSAHVGHFYNFEGLRNFKARFDPVWTPRYLAAAGGLDPAIVTFDVAALIGGGLLGVVAR